MAPVKERTVNGFARLLIDGVLWGDPIPVVVDIWSGRDRVTAELQQSAEWGPVDRAGTAIIEFTTNANGTGKAFQTSPRPIQPGQAVSCLHPLLDRLVYWPT
jgi:hypothetical protein